VKNPRDCKSIQEVRQAIDKLDHQIINLIGKRFKYVKEIVKYKEKDKDSIVAKERREAVIQSRRKIAEENGLNPDIIENIYRTLIGYFIQEELNLTKKLNKE
jgi:isochorismate pyruvate lyase